MKNILLSGLSSLLLPLGAYAAVATSDDYQRDFLSAALDLPQAASTLERDLVDFSGDQLDIQTAHPVRELVIVDEGGADEPAAVEELKNNSRDVVFIDTSIAGWESLRDGVKDGVEVVLLDSTKDGFAQIADWAQSHSDYDAMHIICIGCCGGYSAANWRNLGCDHHFQ